MLGVVLGVLGGLVAGAVGAYLALWAWMVRSAGKWW